MIETIQADKLRILETALGLYSKYGLRSVTMDELCRELGMSKKTLYQVVSDKNELIKLVLEHEKELQKQATEHMFQSGLNAIDELIHVNKHLHNSQNLHSPTFYFDLKKLHPLLYSSWLEYKRKRMNDLIVRNLEKGIKEGLYRADLDIKVISKLHMARAETLQNSDLVDNEEFLNTKFLDEVFRYHIHGICNDKGLEFFRMRMNELKNN